MAVDLSLHPLASTGIASGFTNLLRHEFKAFWGSGRALKHAALWTVVLLGGLFAVGFMKANDPMLAGEVRPVLLGALGAMTSWFTVPAVVASTQGAILDERERGTAQWVLSRPVSRTAFVLAKFVALSVGLVLCTLVLQLPLALAVIRRFPGSPIAASSFARGAALWVLHVEFYLALTLMLSTVFRRRAPVIAIPAVLLLLGQALPAFLPRASMYSPWLLVPFGRLVAMDVPLFARQPVYATAAWTLLFVLIAVVRFERDEL